MFSIIFIAVIRSLVLIEDIDVKFISVSYLSLVTIIHLWTLDYGTKYVIRCGVVKCHAPLMPFATNTE